ncbi:MAG: hypothetical protein WBD13_13915, partial [Burkholderiaceae bacterium]
MSSSSMHTIAKAFGCVLISSGLAACGSSNDNVASDATPTPTPTPAPTTPAPTTPAPTTPA